MLPQPESHYGEISFNDKDYSAIYVNNVTEKKYNEYVAACQERGFTVDAEKQGTYFEAFNAQGYKLKLYLLDKMMCISLKYPDLGVLNLSESVLAERNPELQSKVGFIKSDDAQWFAVYIGETLFEDYKA